MRKFSAEGYRLDFASGAWRQVGSLERTDFEKLVEALRQVAVLAAEVPRGPDPKRLYGVPSKLSLAVNEYVAVYDLDHEARTLMVLDIARRLPSAR